MPFVKTPYGPATFQHAVGGALNGADSSSAYRGQPHCGLCLVVDDYHQTDFDPVIIRRSYP
jgi:hypothetical protein